jgi:hypothetical protein
MAMAAWMWALELILESLESFSATKFNLAGILLGLSVAASLSFAAPAVGLILAAMIRRRGSAAHMPHLAFLITFVLLAVPLNHAEKEVVTQGAANLRQTLNQLTMGSFRTSNVLLSVAVRIAAALLVVAGLITVWPRQRKAPDLAYLTGGTLVLSLLLMLAAHRIAKAAFPEAGALYAIPLFSLLLASIMKPVKIAFLAVATLCMVSYTSQMRLPYRAGREFTGGRALAKILRTDAFPRGVRVGASEDAEGIMRYYRWRYRQGNWQPIERLRDGATYDYYVLTPRDAATVQRRGLQVMYRDAGLVLAK